MCRVTYKGIDYIINTYNNNNSFYLYYIHHRVKNNIILYTQD